jgi:hypothetical protein
VCIEVFTFSMFASACVRDVMTTGAVVVFVKYTRRSKTSSVGCVLRESQTAFHVSSLTQQELRFKSTRPLFSRRAPANARTCWSSTSGLLEICGLNLFRRLFSENDIVNITNIQLGRSLIATKDLCQSPCSRTRKFTIDQLDLEIWS